MTPRAAVVGLLALALLAPLGRAETLVLQCGRVMVGPNRWAPDGVIVVEDGKIVDVGARVDRPGVARVLDFSGTTVIPGFVVASTSLGLSRPGGNPQTDARVRRIDDVDPADGDWDVARRSGLTTLGLVSPQAGVGGRGAIVKPAKGDRAAMTVRDDAPLALGFGADTRTLAALRGGFDAAKRWLEAKAKYDAFVKEQQEAAAKAKAKAKAEAEKAKTEGDAKPDSKPDPKSEPKAAEEAKPKPPPNPPEDPRVMPFVQVLRGEIPAVFQVRGRDGTMSGTLLHLAAFAKEYGLKPIVHTDGPSALMVLDELRAVGARLLVSCEMPVDPRTGEIVNVPKRLLDAKLPFALLPGDNPAAWRHRLALVARTGVAAEALYPLIGEVPATFLGLGKRVGKIAKGCDADLIFLDGDPLDPLARVVRVMVAGETVWERPEAAR